MSKEKEVVPEKKGEIRPFYLKREKDVTGTSGTGVVAIGAELASGKCVMEWRTKYYSLSVFNSISDIADIHGHKGHTKVIWGYPDEEVKKVKRKPRKKTIRKVQK